MPGMLKAETSSVSASFACQPSSLLSSSPTQRQPSPEEDGSSSASALDRWSQQLRSEERGLWLIHLLYSCANAVASNNLEYGNLFLEQLSVLASPRGDPMQRVASYFMEALAARMVKCWPGVYKALHCTRLPSSPDTASARQIFFNVSPFVKFAFLSVNQAILDAMEGEKVVHVVDLDACDVVQWLALVQAFSRRSEGPPHLRITVVSQRKEVLHVMAQRLSEEAERLDIPFQFHPVQVKVEALDAEMLGVKTGEALAVSSVLRLHCLLAHHPKPDAPSPAVPFPHLQTRSSSPHGNGWVAETSGKDQRKPRRAAFDSVGGSGRERHLPQASSLVRNGSSKRSRDGDEAQTRESVKRETVSEISNGIYHPIFDSPPSTSTSAIPSIKREQDDWEITAETAHQNGKNLFSLLEKRGTDLQNGRWSEGGAIDRVLRMLRSLCPKLMVVVEQESNHNGSTLVERFAEALHYYSALFDSMDSTLPQLSAERLTLENNLFGQEIHNIIACEGVTRVERHEKLDSWRRRMEKAGFAAVKLSSSTMIQAERLLGGYACEGYRLMEDGGCLTICWHGTPLFSSSAWQI